MRWKRKSQLPNLQCTVLKQVFRTCPARRLHLCQYKNRLKILLKPLKAGESFHDMTAFRAWCLCEFKLGKLANKTGIQRILEAIQEHFHCYFDRMARILMCLPALYPMTFPRIEPRVCIRCTVEAVPASSSMQCNGSFAGLGISISTRRLSDFFKIIFFFTNDSRFLLENHRTKFENLERSEENTVS